MNVALFILIISLVFRGTADKKYVSNIYLYARKLTYPKLLFYLSIFYASDKILVTDAIMFCFMWINFYRYYKYLLPHNFDPSGHIFVLLLQTQLLSQINNYALIIGIWYSIICIHTVLFYHNLFECIIPLIHVLFFEYFKFSTAICMMTYICTGVISYVYLREHFSYLKLSLDLLLLTVFIVQCFSASVLQVLQCFKC